MKKRVITGMMTASVIVSLAGCGAGQKETVESTAPATMTETVAASQVETAEVTETETTVQADRASRIKAYQAALENIYQNHILPDGSELRDDISGEMSGNKFAVYDVDHDGREELVFCYTATSMASMTAKIYDYDEASGELYEELLRQAESGDKSSVFYRHHMAYMEKNNFYIKSHVRKPYAEQEKNQLVVDYLASMTYDYFIALYHYLFPKGKHDVKFVGYFDL